MCKKYKNTCKKYLLFLHQLIGKMFVYGIKSPDCDLYDFGFGDVDSVNKSTNPVETCDLFLHFTCRFIVIYKGTNNRKCYDEFVTQEEFEKEIKPFLGMVIKNVKFSKQNDLIIDFDRVRIILVTFSDKEESWRLFSKKIDNLHLVVSNSWMEFQ